MPRRFRFSLQKVLELRQHDEKQAELALAAKTGECSLLEQAIQGLFVTQAQTFRQRTQAGNDWSALRSYDLYSQRLEREIEKQEKLLAQKLVERESLLQVYLEAQKKRKILEKVEEKQAAEFRAQEQKRQALILDDLNTAAYIRKMNPMEGKVG